MDYFIKAADEASFWQKLTEAGIVTESTSYPAGSVSEEDKLELKPTKEVAFGLNLDVIGTVFAPTGKTIEVDGPSVEKLTVPEMVAIEGFHANLRGNLTPEQEAQLADILIEKPTSPVRVWA